MSYFTSTHSFVVIILCFLTGGCSQRALQDARETVHQADSLWHAVQMYDDSAALAQTYETLDAWRYFYADDYAHACYHYGKLLRAQDDPVSAMQAFIHATHSRTRDYHILGRIYNNMGAICHLAGEFPLSYEMFEKSGDMFLREQDTLSYYYCLNDMALELAVMGKKDSSIAIIESIKDIHDSILLGYCLYSQAEAFLRSMQCDSTIVYAHHSKQYLPSFSGTTLQLAQAYSMLGKRDSAAYYANIVLSFSHSLFEKNNALYILTNDDETKDKKEIRETAADRSDVQKQIEDRRSVFSQAALLLNQDLNRKPDLLWLCAVCITLFVIGGCWLVYVHQKRKKHMLLSQKIRDLEIQKHESIEQKMARVYSNCMLYVNSKDIKNLLYWTDFETMCGIVDQQFYMLASKLRNKHTLNEKETRLCILVLFNMNRSEISDMLPYALNSVGKLKDHTAKLLGTTGKNLHDFLVKLATEE